MSGESFDLNKDSEILKLNSPKNSVKGPYKVVYKDVAERWVIVALDWDEKPSLAMRWFWGNGGNPFSSGNPTWLIIPSPLLSSILNGLPLPFKFRKLIEGFLNSEIDGDKL
jgi:hypothetical protein